MAGKLPVYSLPGAQGKPGSPGDPGYQGSMGMALGSSIGAISGAGAGIGSAAAGTALAAGGWAAGPVGGLIGLAAGAAIDWLFGGAGSKKAVAAKPPPSRPGFHQPAPYKASGANLRDPGAGPGMGMPQDVRLAAAGNIKKKIFGGP